jgi:hypothetical protein
MSVGRNALLWVPVLFCGLVATAKAAVSYVPPPSRENVFEFTAEPKAVKKGETYEITFASKGKCDVTVAVTTADGRVVRHLAAGVLGKNAPPPLQKNTLVQTLVWDGKDDQGNPAPANCRVRVSLGLHVEFNRLLWSVPEGVASRGPVGMVCDDQGALYVAEGALGCASVGTLLNIKVFDGDGNYLRTVMPFRADWPPEMISAVEFLDTAEGRRIPLSGPNRHRPFSGFTPGIPGMQRQTPLRSKGGLVYLVGGQPIADDQGRSLRRLFCVGNDGSVKKEWFAGPPLPNNTWAGDVFLAFSPDEKFIYISGTRSRRSGPHHAVYRTTPDAKEPPEKPFLGVEGEAGGDKTHLRQPRGVACDAAGRLYVCDYLNDRIQVFSADGEYQKTVAVVGPEQVAVHPRTGALYVLSVKDRGKTERYSEVVWELYEDKALLKLRSAAEPVELSRLDLPTRKRYFHDCGPILCLDASKETSVLWLANVGRQSKEDFLWKVVDEPDGLKKVPHRVIRYEKRQSVLTPCVAADRENNEFYIIGDGLDGVYRYRPEAAAEKIPIPGCEKLRVGDAAVGPNGRLYISSGETLPDGEKTLDGKPCIFWRIRRYARDGGLVPFKNSETVDTLGHHHGAASGEKSAPFAVAPDGKIYVAEWVKRGGPRCRVNVYSADGVLLKEGLISDLTATAGDVAVDGWGNLYVADAVKPVLPGFNKGDEFPSFLGRDPRNHFRYWYGTVCRFGPEGGAFDHLAKDEDRPPTHWGSGNVPVELRGALWQYYGISPFRQSAGCECTFARMDADGWGRVWLPDVLNYAVRVLDSAGNPIIVFGDYGNRDALGPNSAVPKPEIPFLYPEAVAALDGHAAVVDGYNRRIVEVKFQYAVEETVPAP